MIAAPPPLIGYISATRIGHVAWETIAHCSYARSQGRKLLLIMSPSVVNSAFPSLFSDSARFLSLPSIHEELDNPREPSPAQLWPGQGADVRMTSDHDGLIFDSYTTLRPDLRSRPFESLFDGYWKCERVAKYFEPLKIHDAYETEGTELLKKLGLSRGDWFVCVHARESSYLGDTQRENMNQSISNYFAAIEHITARGGYVIRMGDAGTTKLPPMDRVIDYAHSPHRSDFADLYLCAKAKFFLGSRSGLSLVPQMFNTPLLRANFWPITPHDANNLGLTLYAKAYSHEKGRCLTMREVLADPNLCYREWDDEYRQIGLTLVENTPEEILDGVIEMFEILDAEGGNKPWTPEQDRFQSDVRAAIAQAPLTIMEARCNTFPDFFCRVATKYLAENW